MVAPATDPPSTELPTEHDVMQILRGVIDPELGSDIVDLGMAKGATIADDGLVTVTVALTTAGCPLRAQIQRDVRTRVGDLPGVTNVKIDWTELTQEEKAGVMAKARRNIAENPRDNEVSATTKVLLVASGKGGVGKSSIAVNLAAGLAAKGLVVGLMDADIWGFSVPRMLGIEGRLEGADDKKILPNETAVGDGTLKVVSMGFLVDQEDSALMWRGLILNRAVQHFIEDVLWGELDYLIIDMPPGTGDVQMGLAKLLPQADMILVTTPARNAQKVAARAASMGRNNYLRIAGVVENMSAFVTPDGESHAIFGRGGGQQLATDIDAPLLASIPIDASVAEGGDVGRPAVLGEGPAAEALRALVEVVFTEAAPPIDMAGCSARIIEAVREGIEGGGPVATPVNLS